MEIILIIFLIIVLAVAVFTLFKILKWVFTKKERALWLGMLFLCLVVGITINKLFFTKMEFVQSKVYPNLYLVKNEIEDKEALKVIIKKKVLEIVSKGLINNAEIYSENTYKAPYATLAFYTYTKNSIFSVFQDYGTAYFLDHEEDLGGFVVEDLGMYQKNKLATYNLRTCKKDSRLFCGVLDFFKEGYVIKTDTLPFTAKKDNNTNLK